ncbi:PBP1A family penicillin-binding protein [Bacillus sp. FJAT-45350]|uniref:PBP1A family penicillin-binding protein n=1 Tax=Bacillus sp. FJAT-45350 TaxID=2011014 RepID=UPI000BB953FC|nr:PBP1A family penicillin-binding protein [Bacillus sp. FJAT-45350]
MSEQNMNSRQGRRRAKEQSNAKSKRKPSGLLKKILLSGLIMAVIAVVAGGITLFAMIKDAPPLDRELLMFSQPAEILDQNDETVSLLQGTENRVNVSIHDVPQVLEDAFIATEDVRFREHFGLDVRRIMGAIGANITGGFGAEGASTITQQVVKNAFFTFEKTITRKVQEQYLAVKLEQQYSKDQILEMYLNVIYFGEGAYGVLQASRSYFGKELEELTVEDAALLAGIPQRPNHFNPLKNPEGAETRRNTVISLMERHGKITSSEADLARAVSVEDQLNPAEKASYPYESFLNLVLSEVEDMEGISATDLYTAGLKIYTTLDQDAQAHVERVLQTDELINGYPTNEDFQAGLTLLDTQTGEIKAIGGGRQNTGVKRGFNYATDIKKQPGSTIKPVLDYGPVIEHHQWSTGEIIIDEPHTYNDHAKTPVRNYTRSYEGPVTMRRALARSLNVPAIKALQTVGTNQAQAFAEGVGIPFDEKMTEAYGIGGFKTGISTLDLAGSYQAFGNEGQYIKPHTVRKIEFPDGRIIHTNPDSETAMQDYTAYMVTDMLKSVVTEGTGTIANIPQLHLAGKTGTTNFSTEDQSTYNIPSGGVPDVWFAGYTTRYTAAVWTGFDRKGQGNYLSGNERRLAQQIFKAVLEEVSKGIDTPDFRQPPSVVKVGIERSTGLLPSDFTPSSEIVYELFVKGTEPTRVSESFNQLTAPSNLTAGYNEDTDQLIMSWSYPEAEQGNVSFRVSASIDGGEFTALTITNDMQYILSHPQLGATYRLRVTAISDDVSGLESDPVEANVSIPDMEIDIPDPIEDVEPIEEEEEPQRREEEEPIDIIPDLGEPLEDEPDDNEEEPQTTE